jgi:hypothetical protein
MEDPNDRRPVDAETQRDRDAEIARLRRAGGTVRNGKESPKSLRHMPVRWLIYICQRSKHYGRAGLLRRALSLWLPLATETTMAAMDYDDYLSGPVTQRHNTARHDSARSGSGV